MGMLKDLYNFRGFILSSVKREYQSKYRNSMLGSIWSVINPLAIVIVYTVIFSQVMEARLPGVNDKFGYSIYLCAGIFTWGLFSDVISRSQNIFFENSNLIKKVNFPRVCLPAILVLNALLNFAIVFTLFTAFLFFSGNFPGLVYIAIVPLLILQLIFSIGLGVILGVLNVFFRDIGQLMSIILQFWFWLTPIVYSRSILSPSAQSLMSFNPLANLMGAYQGICVLGEWPDWNSLIPLLIESIALCFFALHLFRRRAGEIVDEL